MISISYLSSSVSPLQRLIQAQIIITKLMREKTPPTEAHTIYPTSAALKSESVPLFIEYTSTSS